MIRKNRNNFLQRSQEHSGKQMAQLQTYGSAFSNLHVFVDFDGTISSHDTTDVLVRNVIKQIAPEDPNVLKDLLDRYDGVKDHYNSQFSKFYSRYIPGDPEYRSKRAEFDIDTFNYLVDSNVIAGLSAPWDFPVNQVNLRPGVFETLHPLIKNEAKVKVLSLSVSGDDLQTIIKKQLDLDLEVVSNRFEVNPEKVTTGNIFGGFRTSFDKIDSIRSQLSSVQEELKVIMIGDSYGDFDALVKSNMGILIKEKFDSAFVHYTPLEGGHLKTAAEILDSKDEIPFGTIVLAKDWTVVKQILESTVDRIPATKWSQPKGEEIRI